MTLCLLHMPALPFCDSDVNKLSPCSATSRVTYFQQIGFSYENHETPGLYVLHMYVFWLPVDERKESEITQNVYLQVSSVFVKDNVLIVNEEKVRKQGDPENIIYIHGVV